MRGGKGVTKDLTKAAEWYRKAAEQGLGSAQDQIGRCYEGGYGVTKDLTKAAEWYRKAAEQGLGLAQYHLGRCYEGGHGVTKDLTKAAEWYQKAADKGYDKKLLQQGCDVGSAVAAGAALAVTGLIWKILRG